MTISRTCAGLFRRQLIEHRVGRGRIEAGHQDGRFAKSVVGKFHGALVNLSDPRPEDVGRRIGIFLDQFGKLVAERRARTGHAAEAAGSGHFDRLFGLLGFGSEPDTRIETAADSGGAAGTLRSIDRNMPRLNSTRPTIAIIGQFCPSHVRARCVAAGAGISAGFDVLEGRDGHQRRRILDLGPVGSRVATVASNVLA